jgi:hypothetical protein
MNFMKPSLAALLCLIFLQAPLCSSYQDLKKVAESYVAFLQRAGQTDLPITNEDVARVFSSSCEKIENGTVLFKSSKDIPNQWMSARKTVGKWTIDLLFMTASSEDKTCTLQIVWKADKMPPHTTMIVLFVDEEGKIKQIREVYNAYKKTLAN